jgi:hypothetical protein
VTRLDPQTLADELSRLLFEHGDGGSWVRCAPAPPADEDGRSGVRVIEADEQRSFVIVVQEYRP